MENIAQEVPDQGRDDWREEAVRAIIDTRQVTSHFQPIPTPLTDDRVPP